MAITADIVEVQLRADTDQYLRNLGKADKQFTQMAQRAEIQAREAGRAFSTLGAQADAGFNQVAMGAQRAAVAASSARSSFSGVAAQFQDIGVTAAAGMNPLIIALQQGTQLSAQLQVSAQNGQGVFRALATGVAGLINPISIATIATIALGTAAVQWLGNITAGSASANDAIRAHREALAEIVEGYSNAEDAVEQYFAAASRLPQFLAIEGTRQQFDELGRIVTDFEARVDNLAQFLLDADSGVGQLGRELGETVRQFRDGEISAEEFYRALQVTRGELGAVDSALGSMGLGLGAIISELEAGTIATIQFGNAINSLVASSIALADIATDQDLSNILNLQAYIEEQERLNSLTAEELALEREIAAIRSEAGDLGITDERAAQLARERLAAEERRAELAKQIQGQGKSYDASLREAERERQAVLTLIDNLEHELELLGMTNRERAISNALRQAGTAATAEQIAEIERLTGAIYDTREAQAQLDEASREWADTMQSATRSFIDDLLEGKDAAEAFGNVLRNIGNQLINMGLSSIFGGGGPIQSLFGNIPPRANGGPVSSGRTYLVGERGPELFTPSSGGRITANHDLGGGGGDVVFAPQIDARGADVAAVARLEASLSRMMSEFEPRVKSIVRGRNRAWT